MSLIRTLVSMLERGDAVAQATVIRTRGSAPQEVGAKMLVGAQGLLAGTVGGGSGEAVVIASALDVLETAQPRIVLVDLAGEIGTDSGPICGGAMDVFVERLPRASFGLREASNLLELEDARAPAVVITIVAAAPTHRALVGTKLVVAGDQERTGGLGLGALERGVLQDAREALGSNAPLLTYYPAELRHADASVSRPGEPDVGAEPECPGPSFYDGPDGFWVFIEPLRRSPSMLIVGAGHIAQPLAAMAAMSQFHVTVLDDRSEFANRARFPDAHQIIAAPVAEELGRWPLHDDSYVVLVTRGHEHDLECLLALAGSEPAYIGMIGSRRRVAGVFELLTTEYGVSPAWLQRVHAPIGLDIRAKTPAEIAVSILAEVIMAYRGGTGHPLSIGERLSAIGGSRS